MIARYLTTTTRIALAALCALLAALAANAKPADDTPAPAPPATPTVSAALAAVPPATEAAPVYGLLDSSRPCTGVLVDARHLAGVQRCQSPVLIALTDTAARDDLYPDPQCLPSLSNLQENGIVRFYHTVADARAGFVGDNPLFVRATATDGPFHGNLLVSKGDGAKLRELETRIHFTKTWHVGYLLPGDK